MKCETTKTGLDKDAKKDVKQTTKDEELKGKNATEWTLARTVLWVAAHVVEGDRYEWGREVIDAAHRTGTT